MTKTHQKRGQMQKRGPTQRCHYLPEELMLMFEDEEEEKKMKFSNGQKRKKLPLFIGVTCEGGLAGFFLYKREYKDEYINTPWRRRTERRKEEKARKVFRHTASPHECVCDT